MSTCNTLSGFLRLVVIVLSAIFAIIGLGKSQAEYQTGIQPLWDIDTNDTQPCNLKDRNTSDGGIFLHGNFHHTCSLQITAPPESYTVIETPKNGMLRELFTVYIERESDWKDCDNKYVVIHGQINACSTIFVENSFRLHLQGNVSVLVNPIPDSVSIPRCPELRTDIVSTQNVSGRLSVCNYVKGYDNQVTCNILNEEACILDFSSNCNATIGHGDVSFQCMYNDLLQTETTMLVYPPVVADLDLSSNNIHNIEGYSFQGLVNLQTLRLEINYLKTLNAHVFYGLHNLHKLTLYRNELYELEIGVFQGLEKLAILDLDNNKLSVLHDGLFLGLINLQALYLQANLLHTLIDGVFSGLGKLSHLYLSYNNLNTLPANLFRDVGNLYALLLYDNQLDTLDANVFDRLGKLTFLYLHNNNLPALPEGIFEGLENLYKMFLFGNPLEELHSDVFHGLGGLTSLHIHAIQLVIIPNTLFEGLENLIILVLSQNKLSTINDSVFEDLRMLRQLDISINELISLPVKLFQSLINLNILYLEGNKLMSLDKNIFHGLTKLTLLTLNDNNLISLPVGLFQGLNYLDELYLYNNHLTALGDTVFHPLRNLRILSMGGNQLVTVPNGAFNNLRRLEFLSMEKNYLELLGDGIFHGLFNLHFLYMRTNRLHNLNVGIFRDLSNISFIELSQNHLDTFPDINHLTGLNFLNLRNNSLRGITHDTFSSLNIASELYVSQHEICECYAPVGVNCSAADGRSPYLTCDRLLSDRVLVVLMWIIGLNALGGNVFVLLWRQKTTKKYKVQDLLLSNLALSDSLMGVYMMIIASADIYYGDNFPMQSEIWRSGITCRIAGAISIASSEASVLFLTLISIDRCICMKFPYSTYKMGKQAALVIILLTWACSLALGIAPSIVSGRNFKFYDNSHVCIGLPLALTKIYSTSITTSRISPAEFKFNYPKYTFDTRYTGLATGLYFSTALFLGLNCLCYLVILGCYIEIVRLVKKSSKQSGRTRDMKEQLTLTTKVTAIVATDFMCWFPIIILGILVQSRVITLPPSVYAWSVTFVIPLNSAINPYLYTIAEIISNYRKNRKAENGSSTKSISMQQIG